MYKSSIIDVQIGSKYASVSITLHLTFLEELFWKVDEMFKGFTWNKKKKKKILSTNVKDITLVVAFEVSLSIAK